MPLQSTTDDTLKVYNPKVTVPYLYKRRPRPRPGGDQTESPSPSKHASCTPIVCGRRPRTPLPLPPRCSVRVPVPGGNHSATDAHPMRRPRRPRRSSGGVGHGHGNPLPVDVGAGELLGQGRLHHVVGGGGAGHEHVHLGGLGRGDGRVLGRLAQVQLAPGAVVQHDGGHLLRALHLDALAVDHLARRHHLLEDDACAGALVDGDVVHLPLDLDHALGAVVDVHRLARVAVLDHDLAVLHLILDDPLAALLERELGGGHLLGGGGGRRGRRLRRAGGH
mmetsp:Transcript_14239/g.30493  ORF Transcript_14239/g.30493 Transcript_14239/m.30493 type:complete len:278 (+) Transcript_14239:156-989(+)